MRNFKKYFSKKVKDEIDIVSMEMIEFCNYLKQFTHTGEIEVKVIPTKNDYHYLSIIDYDPPGNDQEFDMSVDMLFLTIDKKNNTIHSVENYFKVITPANKKDLIMISNLVGIRITDIEDYLNKTIRNSKVISDIVI